MNIDKRENCLQEKLFVFLYGVFGEHISTRFRKWEGKQIFFNNSTAAKILSADIYRVFTLPFKSKFYTNFYFCAPPVSSVSNSQNLITNALKMLIFHKEEIISHVSKSTQWIVSFAAVVWSSRNALRRILRKILLSAILLITFFAAPSAKYCGRSPGYFIGAFSVTFVHCTDIFSLVFKFFPPTLIPFRVIFLWVRTFV